MYITMDGWPFGWVSDTCRVPQGYELVEKEDHKKQRLEAEVENLERQVEYHSSHGAAAADKLKELKKDLEKCK